MHYRTLGRTGINVSAIGLRLHATAYAGRAGQDRRAGSDPTAARRDRKGRQLRGYRVVLPCHEVRAGGAERALRRPGAVGRMARSRSARDEAAAADHQGPRGNGRYLTQQLERLQTDHVDFYLVHGLDGDAWNRMRDLGVREFLDGERARGRIRFPAFSFHGQEDDFPRIIDEYDDWAFGQIQYNYMDTDYQAGFAGLRYAAKKGIGVVVMEPLKGGRLAKNLPPEMKAVFDKRPEGWSPAEWALRYVWNEAG